VEVIPFSDRVKDIKLNAKDSIMTNAELIASKLGGGTACSAPVAMLNGKKAKGDLIVIVSDNQSWLDAYGTGRETRLMAEWTSFRARNKNAKMVCIDLQPSTTTQAYEREDIMNIGGWSDSSLRIINQFNKGELDAQHWVDEIEKIDLDKVIEKAEYPKK
jgi:60 kDa SS-A/Ro ribonucleoprotein